MNPTSRWLSWSLLVCSLATACAHGRSDAGAPFALEWRGVDAGPLPSPLVAEGLRHHTLYIENFVDGRAEPSRIGTVQGTNQPVHTTTNVAAFCTQKLTDMLAGTGVKLAQTGATMTLKPELVAYDVIEAGMFNGEVVIRVSALVDGKLVYEGTHGGKSKRWGRSHNPVNYNEALSNALAEATRRLLNDDVLAKALRGEAPATPTGPAPAAKAS
jgi:hypothetical protein